MRIYFHLVALQRYFKKVLQSKYLALKKYARRAFQRKIELFFFFFLKLSTYKSFCV